MLLIARSEQDSNLSKRDLVLNLFYSGCYLPFTYWLSQSHGSDCLCRMKNCISMLLLMLTHFIVLDHLSIKFIETLKSLNSTDSKGMCETFIFYPPNIVQFVLRPSHSNFLDCVRVGISNLERIYALHCEMRVSSSWDSDECSILCEQWVRDDFGCSLIALLNKVVNQLSHTI